MGVSHQMSGRAFQTEGLQCPAPRLEHRVGWNKSKKTGSGDRPCRLVGHVLALAFSLREMGSRWGVRIGQIWAVF